MLEDEDAWRAFRYLLAPVRPLLAAAAVTQPLLGRFDWAWYLAPSRRVARSDLHHARLARARGRILEKTPRHVEHVGRLFACFPRAKLLYIHRHRPPRGGTAAGLLSAADAGRVEELLAPELARFGYASAVR
jgi:Sulfotransferase family